MVERGERQDASACALHLSAVPPSDATRRMEITSLCLSLPPQTCMGSYSPLPFSQEQTQRERDAERRSERGGERERELLTKRRMLSGNAELGIYKPPGKEKVSSRSIHRV